MGYVLKVSCNGCGSEKAINLGNGIKDFNANVVAQYFKDEAPDIIFDNDEMWFFNWKLGHCKECNNLFRVPTVTTFKDNKDKIEFKEAVCECGSRDVVVYENERERNISCNKCSEEYTVTEIGYWD